MKKLYINLLFTFGVLCANGQAYNWVISGGGSLFDEAYCVKQDQFDNTYITGTFSGSASFGGTAVNTAGSADVFLAKYDPSGALIWIQPIGSTGNQGGHMVTVDNAGDVFVAGEFEGSITIGPNTFNSSGMSDVFVAKYSSGGNYLWAIQGGSTGEDVVNSIETDGNDNVVITGEFENIIYFGTSNVTSFGGIDVYIAKFTSIGAISWLLRAGSLLDDLGRGIAVDINDDIVITGNFQLTATFGPFGLNAVNSGKDIFVSKISSLGTFMWAVKAGGQGNDASYEIESDGATGFYLCGAFRNLSTFGSINVNSSGDEDIFVAKINSNGAFQWVRTAGGPGADKGYAITYSPAAGIIFTGSFESTCVFGSHTVSSAGDKDIIIGCLNQNGVPQWVNRAGGTGFDRGYGITSNAFGSIWVTGGYTDAAEFGNSFAILNSAGSNDVFVARIETVTSIEETDAEAGITIYPNPVAEVLNITIAHSGGIKIFDATGQLVFTEVLNPGEQSIKVSGFRPGIYFCELTTEEKSYSHKLLIE